MRVPFRVRLFLPLVLCVASVGLWPPAAQSTGADDVLAMVGGVAIRNQQVEERWQATSPEAFFQWRQQTYDAKARVLDELVGEEVLSREAARRGVAVVDLLKEELPRHSRPVTEDRIRDMFERVGNPPAGVTFDVAKASIIAYLEQQEEKEARRRYVDELRRSAGSAVVVNWRPTRQTVMGSEDDPVKGSPSAAVEIVEFSDFQCPYCRHLQPVLKKLLGKYGDKVRLVWKDFPLPVHVDAKPAAIAARCAGEQGKFWEYHDVLFGNQEMLNRGQFIDHASALHLNTEAFIRCLDSGKYRSLLADALETGKRYGIGATPTVFINGRRVAGSLPIETYERIVDEELQAN